MAKPKGFRYLMMHDPDKLEKIARKGGQKSQEGPNAKRWSTTEARAQGRKGAEARWSSRKTKGAA